MNIFDLIGNAVISAYTTIGGALKKLLALAQPEKILNAQVKLLQSLLQGRRPPPRIVEDQPRKVANRTSLDQAQADRSAAAYRSRYPSESAGAPSQHPSANALRAQQVRDGVGAKNELQKVLLDLQELKKLLEHGNKPK